MKRNMSSSLQGYSKMNNKANRDEKLQIDCFHDPIMQHVLGGSLHKNVNNTSYLILGLYHASVN